MKANSKGMLEFIRNIRIPIWVALVFTLATLFPVLHFMVLTADGGLCALLRHVLHPDHENELSIAIVNWSVNLPLAMLFLYLLFRSKRALTDGVYSILSVSFLFSLIAFSMGDRYWEASPYFMFFMVISMVAGMIVCLVDFSRSLVQ